MLLKGKHCLRCFLQESTGSAICFLLLLNRQKRSLRSTPGKLQSLPPLYLLKVAPFASCHCYADRCKFASPVRTSLSLPSMRFNCINCYKTDNWPGKSVSQAGLHAVRPRYSWAGHARSPDFTAHDKSVSRHGSGSQQQAGARAGCIWPSEQPQ